MPLDSADDDASGERSHYVVVAHGEPGLLTPVQLRPDGWLGPDLHLLAIGTNLDRFPIGSVHVVTPEQRQRWRDTGILV